MAGEPPLTEMVTLNLAGNYRENPIMSGAHFRITLHKHSSDDVLVACWITVDDVVYADITARCVDGTTTTYVDVEAGVDLVADAPAQLNMVHFTMSESGHIKRGVYVATAPVNVVEIDGYNAEDVGAPFIYRLPS